MSTCFSLRKHYTNTSQTFSRSVLHLWSEASQKEKISILYWVYRESREMILSEQISGQKRTVTYRMVLWIQGEKERGWDNESTHHVWNSQPAGSRCRAQGAQLMLSDGLEGWDGVMEEAWEGGNICVHTADSSDVVQQKLMQYCNYPPVNIFK